MTDSISEKNSNLAIKLVLFAFFMFGFGYALVPLYDVFCDITGINGKTDNQAVSTVAYEVDLNREVTVEFITSLNESTAMQFKAVEKKLRVHPGEYYTVDFFAKNNTNKIMVARAIPSLSPGIAAEYFKKTECFCFSEQQFEAGEEKLMPVRFVIDPQLPERYKTVTLSYTFFDITKQSDT